MPEQTPGQTVGPFFGYALPFVGGPEVRAPWQPDAIRLHGVVLDGAGSPVPDALVEVWGADGSGRPSTERGSLHRDPHGFTGFGRAATTRGRAATRSAPSSPAPAGPAPRPTSCSPSSPAACCTTC